MTIVKIPVGRVSVKLLEKHDRVAARYLRDGSFEPESLAEWARLAGDGGNTMIDCGAYTGLYTIAGRLLGCRVFAIEPMRENCERLRTNAILNEVSQAVFLGAAGDFDGKVVIHHSPVSLTSGASLIERQTRRRSRFVSGMTIDSLVLDEVTAIKIDVESAEAAVLRGAQETLDRCGPEIIVELLSGDYPDGKFPVPFGYHIARQLDVRNYLMSPG